MLSDKFDFLDMYNPKALAAMLAVKVRKLRLSVNMSQQGLADKSGVSLGTVKRFENSSEISMKHLLMIAVALQATEEFNGLFPDRPFHRLDDLLKEQNVKKRQRGRNKI
jgi:transcriptional regulator with XRE-family HTH domain